MIHQAFWLEYLTLAWMTVEAAVAIASGICANSLIWSPSVSTALSSSLRLEF